MLLSDLYEIINKDGCMHRLMQRPGAEHPFLKKTCTLSNVTGLDQQPHSMTEGAGR